MTQYSNVTPSRRLIGGERFSIVLERDVPLWGMSRIDTVLDAWGQVGESRYFYTIAPSRQAATVGDQRVGTLSIRSRPDRTNLEAVTVGQAMDDLARHLGFMRIRRVDAVDARDATSVEELAKKADEERAEGAGRTGIQKAADAAKRVTGTAGEVFARAFGTVQIALVVGAAVVALLVVKELRGTK